MIESANREAVLGIHYCDFEDNYDEVLYRNSARLAREGSFTSRKDIPQYIKQPSLKIINKMPISSGLRKQEEFQKANQTGLNKLFTQFTEE